MKALNCNREAIKKFFIIHLFGGDYSTWLTNCNLTNKEKCKTDFMTKLLKRLTSLNKN